jgi:hypothetical protein
MATTFCKSDAKIAVQDQGNQNIINKKDGNGAIPPSAIGNRIVPKDGYSFIAGSTAHFQATFTDTDKPIQIDTGFKPRAVIRAGGMIVEEVEGDLSEGQLYEYSFFWQIPMDINPRASYTVEYRGQLGGLEYVWGSEYFKVAIAPQNIKLKQPAYATVAELRLDKPNIDSYLPIEYTGDKLKRDYILHQQLVTSSKELNGQLNLRDFHSTYNDNFNLYVRYHSIWSIIGSQMGEDGSTVSERTLNFWEKKWKAVLKQIKMHSQLSNIPTGRA